MEGKPDLMVPVSCRVRRVIRETHDSFTLELAPGEGSRSLDFLPGQFNMLYVFGVGEVPISFSGDPVRSHVIVHTVRAVGAVTRAISKLRKGDWLGIRGPYGSHWPLKEAEGNDVVIVAGGIGLAPLRPVLYSLLSRRDRFGNVVLLYGARSPGEILYRKELEKWRGRFDMQVEITVDAAGTNWRGNVGVVTALIPRARFDPSSTMAMVCGPELMMRFTVQDLLKSGVNADHIFLTMERNMKCAVGFCGHCQFGPEFVCRDGPVFCYERIRPLFTRREI